MNYIIHFRILLWLFLNLNLIKPIIYLFFINI